MINFIFCSLITLSVILVGFITVKSDFAKYKEYKEMEELKNHQTKKLFK